MIEPILDIRHKRVIKEIKEGSSTKEVLVVGAGDCKIDYHLLKDGWNVYSTDYTRAPHFDNAMAEYFSTLNYSIANIFNLNSFPVKQSEVVVCCEVLEHLVEYKEAFQNLLALTKKRLIIGFPWRRSFFQPGPPPVGHCNFWDDNATSEYTSVDEFKKMCSPHNIHIEKILTKPQDVERNQRSYLLVIDKKNS